MNNHNLGEVVRLDVYSIGVYHPQGKKTYHANYDANTEGRLQDVTNDFHNFSGSSFFGVAADILELNPEHLEAYIVNGWTEPRLRFTIEFANPLPNQRDRELRTILTGHFDSHDVMLEEEGRLADDAIFTINNVVQFTVDVVANHTATKYNGKIINNRNSNDGGYDNDTFTQTNSNAVRTISILDIEELMDDDDEDVLFPDLMNQGSQMVSGRQNNVGNYIGHATNAINVSSRNIMASPTPMGERSFHDAREEVVTQAHGYLDERGLHQVPILSELSIICESFLEDNSFMLTDLAVVFPDIDNVTEFIITDPDELSAIEDSEILDDSAEAEIALVIAMACPAVAFEHLMGVVEIDMDTSAEDRVLIATSRPLIPEYENVVLEQDFAFTIASNLERLMDSWEDRYGTVICRAIIDTFGESEITVSLDGGNDATFVIPQFADNSYTPLLSQDLNTTMSIARMLTEVSQQSYRARYNEESPLGE